jgi:hypothetical protein
LPIDLADAGQCIQNVLTVAHLAAGYLCNQPFCDLLASVRSRLPSREIAHRAGLHQPGKAWIVGPRPSMLVIQRVAHGVVNLLPPGRRNVHGLARREFNARHNDVDVLRAVRLFMQNGAPCVLIWFQSSECDTLKVIKHLLDFCVRRFVVLMKSNHRRAVSIHKFQAVNQLADLLWVAAQDLDSCSHLALAVLLTHEIGNGGASAALPMGKKFNVHGVRLSALFAALWLAGLPKQEHNQ